MKIEREVISGAKGEGKDISGAQNSERVLITRGTKREGMLIS